LELIRNTAQKVNNCTARFIEQKSTIELTHYVVLVFCHKEPVTQHLVNVDSSRTQLQPKTEIDEEIKISNIILTLKRATDDEDITRFTCGSSISPGRS
jgi:hypothetical protein